MITKAEILHKETYGFKKTNFGGGQETHEWAEQYKATNISLTLPDKGSIEEVSRCGICGQEMVLVLRSKESAIKYRKIKLVLLWAAWISLILSFALPSKVIDPTSNLMWIVVCTFFIAVLGFVFGNIYGAKAYVVKMKKPPEQHFLRCYDNPTERHDKK